MFFTKKGKVTIVLAFVLLFSIVSSGLNPKIANAAKKKTYGMVKVQTNFLDKYWPKIHKICEKSLTKDGRGDSDYLLAAQTDLESGHLTSDLSRDKNNCLGIDAYPTGSQSAYEHARWFDSLEECFEYHAEKMVSGYETASKYHDDPYTFVECIAGTYAPGSGNYISDVKNLIDKYALYNAQRYWPEIKEAKQNVRRAENMKRETEKKYQRYLRYASVSENTLSEPDLNWIRKQGAVKKIGFLDPTELRYQRTLNTIEDNLRSRKAELKAARKKAYTTYHTIALGIDYGRISATKENLGSSYGEIMREYKKLNK